MVRDYLFVEELEKAFQIKFPQEKMDEIKTTRHLIDYIATQVPITPHTENLTQQSFYKLRRFFLQRLPVSRKRLRPGTLLNELVPSNERKKIWQELNAIYGANSWWDLSRPQEVHDNIFGMLVIIPILLTSVIWGYFPHFTVGKIALIFFALVLVLYSICIKLTDKYKLGFPAGIKTLGDLALLVTVFSMPMRREAGSNWTRNEIKLTIWRIAFEDIDDFNFKEDSELIHIIGSSDD